MTKSPHDGGSFASYLWDDRAVDNAVDFVFFSVNASRSVHGCTPKFTFPAGDKGALNNLGSGQDSCMDLMAAVRQGCSRAPPGPPTRWCSVLLGGIGLTTTYIDGDQLELVLALLTPPNRLACQLALHTGLRINDVLTLRTDQLKPRLTIREAKTGKSRRITIPAKLLSSIKAQAGEVWAWPGRNPSKHRTRQAVWADVKRAQRALRLPVSIGPHSLRKTYAVRQYAKSGDLGKVQAALNHSDIAVTMLYAMADHLSRQRAAGGSRRRSRPR